MSRLSLYLTYVISFNIHLSTFTDEVAKVEGLSDLAKIIYLEMAELENKIRVFFPIDLKAGKHKIKALADLVPFEGLLSG